MRDITFFIPYNIKYLLLENIYTKNKMVYLYNDDYYFSLNFYTNDIFINEDTNTITIKNLNNNEKNNVINNQLNKFLHSWDSLFFNKIKFTGKGFKWKKKSENVFLFFNRAHKCFFIGNNIILRRLSKNRLILLKNNYNHIIEDSIKIRAVRKVNIFTKRGLRFSRQIIFKKRGKTAAQ